MSRVIVLVCTLALSGCSAFTREFRSVERMTWRAMPSDWHGMRGVPGTVVLSWESAPDHHIVINSPDLLQRLQNTGSRVVDVEFQVWGEFGNCGALILSSWTVSRFRKVLTVRAEPQPAAHHPDRILFSAYSTENTHGSPCLSS